MEEESTSPEAPAALPATPPFSSHLSRPYFPARPAAAAFTSDSRAPSGSGAPLAGKAGGAEGDGEGDGPPPKKKKKPARPYADPSVYAHLEGLSDFLADDLDVILCGINPGVKSAELGQHYASPTNHYYKCLVGSGFTDRRLTPAEGHLLPSLYGIGATNLVPRPTAEASELSKEEMRANVPHFLEKVVRCRPRVVAFVGMAIAEVAAVKIKCGLQPIALTFPTGPPLYFYVLPSTSARVVAYQIEDKITIWKDLRAQIAKLKAGEALEVEGSVEYAVESLS
ncbi:hypothetical protein RQP46_002530 [Phenoliferia psychrophenolica]